jgi:ketosteroid isomerase-like protein
MFHVKITIMEHTLTANKTIIYPEENFNKAFFNETVELLSCVRDHDFKRLSEICDDDFGIIDINPEGKSEIIRDRKGWEDWFQGLFANLTQMNAETWSEITNYEAIVDGNMGYCVVDFDQYLVLPNQKMKFKAISTIIWKKVNDVWKESRYHSSLVGVETV